MPLWSIVCRAHNRRSISASFWQAGEDKPLTHQGGNNVIDSKARILLADEEPYCVWIIQNKLERRGYEVLATSDSEAAIGLVGSWEPDLVILGCSSPGLNGYGACVRIREFSSAPIIMLSASARKIDKIKGLELGADDCMTKPFNVNELVARVRALLRRVEFLQQETPQYPLETCDLRADVVPSVIE